MSADVYSRLNFLYHTIEHLVRTDVRGNIALINHHCKVFNQITEKKVLRHDPAIRRRMCKKCCSLLVPGVTATIRHRSNRQKHTVIKCKICGHLKRYNSANDNFKMEEPDVSAESAKHPALGEKGAIVSSQSLEGKGKK